MQQARLLLKLLTLLHCWLMCCYFKGVVDYFTRAYFDFASTKHNSQASCGQVYHRNGM